MIKTNAMRMLCAAKISFEVLEYEVDENDLSGTHIAEQVGYLSATHFIRVFKKATGLTPP